MRSRKDRSENQNLLITAGVHALKLYQAIKLITDLVKDSFTISGHCKLKDRLVFHSA